MCAAGSIKRKLSAASSATARYRMPCRDASTRRAHTQDVRVSVESATARRTRGWLPVTTLENAEQQRSAATTHATASGAASSSLAILSVSIAKLEG